MGSVNKSFDSPEETRNMNKGKVEVLSLGGKQVMRATFEPGWKWSECVKPIAGTDSCQTAHLMYTISGKMIVRMDDGSEIEIKAGDATSIPPGQGRQPPLRSSSRARQRAAQVSATETR